MKFEFGSSYLKAGSHITLRDYQAFFRVDEWKPLTKNKLEFVYTFGGSDLNGAGGNVKVLDLITERSKKPKFHGAFYQRKLSSHCFHHTDL